LSPNSCGVLTVEEDAELVMKTGLVSRSRHLGGAAVGGEQLSDSKSQSGANGSVPTRWRLCPCHSPECSRGNRT